MDIEMQIELFKDALDALDADPELINQVPAVSISAEDLEAARLQTFRARLACAAAQGHTRAGSNRPYVWRHG